MKEPENQDLVIYEFFIDIKQTLKEIPKEDRFCVITGDLVQAGSIADSYQQFKIRFFDRLIDFIPIQNIICIPGNHDVNRQYIEQHRNDYDALLAKNESEFNASIKEYQSYFDNIFCHFISFCKNNLSHKGTNISGNIYNLIPEVSVLCLNSALLSNGGLDEKKIDPPFLKDREQLRLDTSILYDWVQNNDGRTKVLIMHHPIDNLDEDLQHQLYAIINKSVDIIITGHTHFQKYESKICNRRIVHTMTSPQLYSNKKDETNGYSILQFESSDLHI